MYWKNSPNPSATQWEKSKKSVVKTKSECLRASKKLTPLCGLRWFRWYFTIGLHPKACQNHLRSPYYTSQLLGLRNNIPAAYGRCVWKCTKSLIILAVRPSILTNFRNTHDIHWTERNTLSPVPVLWHCSTTGLISTTWDASKGGPLQSWHPVACTSRALTDAETRCTKRVWDVDGVMRCNKLIYGRLLVTV